jgi:putative transposon-encoded protein
VKESSVVDEKKPTDTAIQELSANAPTAESLNVKVKFEIWGEEMIEKRVKLSGNSGRVYLPPNWVGHKVKIIRTD